MISLSSTAHRRWRTTLNRLQQEVTPQGTVTYSWDDANRRTSMTVLGQPQVIYGYDNADRLTTITQGPTVVTIGYDDANRRTSVTLTLPTSVQTIYGYDNSNRLTTITFKKGAVTLGTLIYTYDSAGRRATLAGTWGRTGLPTAVASAVYNANNQQLGWGGQTNSFDLNGNMIADNNNTYTWDTRDRLTSISGGTTASFTYDPAGRRATKTISGTTTQFLFDGSNPVQELSGAGAVVANLLTGLGIDEYFSRTDGLGRRTLLADALGSILALSDDVGNVQTSYTYEPFGGTTVSGQLSSSSFEYTGRENDGTGLYFYRARYLSPSLGRFLGEDPIGFRGGDMNLYAYVFNSPVGANDPSGLGGTACQGPSAAVLPAFSGSVSLDGRKDSLDLLVLTGGGSGGAVPEGRTFYGNYCGPGGKGAAYDEIDAMCQEHDNCYAKCGASAWTNVYGGRGGDQRACMNGCDSKLCSQLMSHTPKNGQQKRAKDWIGTMFTCERFTPNTGP